MSEEKEIADLRAALLESMLGATALVSCVVQALEEADPSTLPRFAKILRQWHGRASNRARREAVVMVEMVGRTLIDQAFPMSSDPSNADG
jgi:hypothetical protein